MHVLKQNVIAYANKERIIKKKDIEGSDFVTNYRTRFSN